MELVYPRCAGIDVGKAEVVVCVRVAVGPGLVDRAVSEWGTRTSDVLALAQHLVGEGVDRVVMEATSDYWKPVLFPLREAGLDVVLAQPKRVKQIPGRKTDVCDAQWLADLAAHDLVPASFVPDEATRQLRDLVRLRESLTRQRASNVQRIEKTLEGAQIKLSVAISDLMGASGQRMLNALVAGSRDPAVLAQMAHPLVKASHRELVEALTGRFTDHHGQIIAVLLASIRDTDKQLARIGLLIEAYFEPDHDPPPGNSADQAWRERARESRALLATIPSWSPRTAEKVLAEIGLDMSAFPTAEHLASWSGLSPGSNQSAGKSKSSKTRKGNKHIRAALGTSVLTLTRMKDTFLAARYRRVRASAGHQRAMLAVQRTMLEAAWHILTNREPYKDLGGDYYDRRRPKNAARAGFKRLRQAGANVEQTGPDTYTITLPPGTRLAA